MKKKDILKSKLEFDNLIKTGQTFADNYFRVFYTPNQTKKSQFGIAVGKKLGNAVVRNKLKRQVRQILTANKLQFSKSFNYIIMVKKPGLSLKYRVKEEKIIALMKKVKK